MPHVGCNNKGHDNSLESSSLTFSLHLPKRSPGTLAFHQSHNPKNWLEKYRPYKENDSIKEEEEDSIKEEEEEEEEEEEDSSKKEEEKKKERRKMLDNLFLAIP